MKVIKPNWTPLEIYEKAERHRQVEAMRESHHERCHCNLCMEWFGLGELLETFTEDEHVGAVIEANKLLEVK